MRRRWRRLRSLSVAQWRVMLASVVLIPAVQLSLRIRGFVRTLEMLGERSGRQRHSATSDDAHRIAEAVAIVSARPVVGARCLGRSMTLWFILRRHGIDAELVIGAESPGGEDLSAHAWVEVAGQPLLDPTAPRSRFASFRVPQPPLRSADR
jgi:hypothetical protein